MIWIYFIKDLPKSVVGNIKTTRPFKYIFLNTMSRSYITVMSSKFSQFWFLIDEKTGIYRTLSKNLFLFCKTIFAIFWKSSVILCLHNFIASVWREWLFELVYKLNDKGKTRYLFQTTLKRYVTITFSCDLIFLEFFIRLHYNLYLPTWENCWRK